jgi:hypothetical protein
MMKSGQGTYECPTSYHKLNFPTQILHGTDSYICIVLGRSYLDFPPIFLLHVGKRSRTQC